MYPSTTLFIAVGRLAIVILVLFSYPLQVLPCRNCLDKLFHMGEQSTKQSDEGEEESEAEDTSEAVEDEHVDTHMSFGKHSALTSAIIVSGFLIAYFVDDLKIGEYARARTRPRTSPLE
jgi:Transmembrane amino acid transporter protein